MLDSKEETTFCPEVGAALCWVRVLSGSWHLCPQRNQSQASCCQLKASLWSQFLSCTLGHYLVGPDDDSSSPGASVCCLSSQDWLCQVAGSMLSSPGQRPISAAFFLSYCLSLSVLQIREAIVSLGSAPPLPSILPQGILAHWLALEGATAPKGQSLASHPQPASCRAGYTLVWIDGVGALVIFPLSSPHCSTCWVAELLCWRPSTTEIAGEEMIHMACENKDSPCSQGQKAFYHPAVIAGAAQGGTCPLALNTLVGSCLAVCPLCWELGLRVGHRQGHIRGCLPSGHCPHPWGDQEPGGMGGPSHSATKPLFCPFGHLQSSSL